MNGSSSFDACLRPFSMYVALLIVCFVLKVDIIYPKGNLYFRVNFVYDCFIHDLVNHRNIEKEEYSWKEKLK